MLAIVEIASEQGYAESQTWCCALRILLLPGAGVQVRFECACVPGLLYVLLSKSVSVADLLFPIHARIAVLAVPAVSVLLLDQQTVFLVCFPMCFHDLPLHVPILVVVPVFY